MQEWGEFLEFWSKKEKDLGTNCFEWLNHILDYRDTFEIPDKEDALYRIYFKKLSAIKKSFACVNFKFTFAISQFASI